MGLRLGVGLGLESCLSDRGRHVGEDRQGEEGDRLLVVTDKVEQLPHVAGGTRSKGAVGFVVYSVRWGSECSIKLGLGLVSIACMPCPCICATRQGLVRDRGREGEGQEASQHGAIHRSLHLGLREKHEAAQVEQARARAVHGGGSDHLSTEDALTQTAVERRRRGDYPYMLHKFCSIRRGR